MKKSTEMKTTTGKFVISTSGKLPVSISKFIKKYSGMVVTPELVESFDRDMVNIISDQVHGNHESKKQTGWLSTNEWTVIVRYW